MTPRAAADQIIKAVKTAMATEWGALQHEFEPDIRQDIKRLVWAHVLAALISIKAKGEN